VTHIKIKHILLTEQSLCVEVRRFVLDNRWQPNVWNSEKVVVVKGQLRLGERRILQHHTHSKYNLNFAAPGYRRVVDAERCCMQNTATHLHHSGGLGTQVSWVTRHIYILIHVSVRNGNTVVSGRQSIGGMHLQQAQCCHTVSKAYGLGRAILASKSAT
jgi:hypothetical protein